MPVQNNKERHINIAIFIQFKLDYCSKSQNQAHVNLKIAAARNKNRHTSDTHFKIVQFRKQKLSEVVGKISIVAYSFPFGLRNFVTFQIVSHRRIQQVNPYTSLSNKKFPFISRSGNACKKKMVVDVAL